jgi:hypothetical protein
MLELGPKAVLTGLARQIARENRYAGAFCAHSASEPCDVAALLKTLAKHS